MIDSTFTGTLGMDDMSRHIPHSVVVPPGARTFHASFTVDPQHPAIGPLPHQLSISVYGPDGARGTRHNNADQSPVISETWASPGYTSGRIEAGEWVVEIDTARILAPGNVNYSLRIWTENTPTEGPVYPPPGQVAPRGPGWYRGDLHGHSEHSDGTWSVTDFVAHARSRHLDFVTLTDHNTVSALPEAKSLAGDDLLVMGGVELTTFNGHCLALGTNTWVEWRIKDGQSMSARANDIMEAGLTYVIAHPMAEGHPWCTGCRWAYADVFPGSARMVEIWNSTWGDLKNDLGVKLFQTWLNMGLRMRATAGTDIHGPQGEEVRVGYNRVWAEDLSEQAILAGLQTGRNLLTHGPLLEMWVQSGDTRVELGQTAPSASGSLHLTLSDYPDGAMLTLTYGGQNGTQELAQFPARDFYSMDLPDMGPCGWVMTSLRCAKGEMLAITNPILFPGNWS